jgi:23S rRNA pseudouridine1911/1915/1917 synthase
MPVRMEIESKECRLDRFLVRLCPDISRSQWESWIGAGKVLVNGVPAFKNGLALSAGDILEYDLPDVVPPAAHMEPENIDLPTLFEDGRLWIVNKPAGLVVHPGPGHRSGTVLNALLAKLGKSAPTGHAKRVGCGAEDAGCDEEADGGEAKGWPGLVHRLDRYTSGCLAMAKDEGAKSFLQAQFKVRTVEKTYLAIARLSRRLPELGSLLVDAPIARHRYDRTKMTIHHSGRPAITSVKVLCTSNGLALVSCGIRTGRTHQIRVHLASLGAPLLGDPLYGGSSAWRGVDGSQVECPHPALHAWKLEMDHPNGGRIAVAAEPPGEFMEWLGAFGLLVQSLCAVSRSDQPPSATMHGA